MDKTKQEILSFFKTVKFKERSHEYFVKNQKLNKSVSNIVDSVAEKTDFELISYQIDKKHNLPRGSTRKLWNFKRDISALIGSRVHFFAELYMFNRSLVPSDNFEKAVCRFWNDLPNNLIPVFPELKMYHKKYLFGGTKDITLYNTDTNMFILGDYKTNENLFKNFKGQMLKPPFGRFLDNAFNKYQIQLSLYQILFEQTGYLIERRILVHLKSDGTYDMYETEDLTTSLKTYLNNMYN